MIGQRNVPLTFPAVAIVPGFDRSDEGALGLVPERVRALAAVDPQAKQPVPVPAYFAFRGFAGASFFGAKKPSNAAETRPATA